MGEPVIGFQGGKMREATCDVEETAMPAQTEGGRGSMKTSGAAWGLPGYGE